MGLAFQHALADGKVSYAGPTIRKIGGFSAYSEGWGLYAERLAKEDPNGAIWANQFDNVANRQAHERAGQPIRPAL